MDFVVSLQLSILTYFVTTTTIMIAIGYVSFLTRF